LSDSESGNQELLLVVDITSLTSSGFIGSSSFQGKRVDIEFDDEDNGLILSPAMSARVTADAGSKVLIFAEDDMKIQTFESVVKGVADTPRFSNSKLYYFVGERGSAIIRLRRA
jgi:hypothetical protein